MIKRWFPPWSIFCLILFATGTVWLRLTIVRITYGINQAEQAIAKARQEKDQLQLKVSSLKSPRRLEVLARGRYGLSQPRVDQVIHLKKSSELSHHAP